MQDRRTTEVKEERAMDETVFAYKESNHPE